MRGEFIGIAVATAFVAPLGIAAYFITQELDQPRPTPAFQPSQMVKMKAFGHEGMVLFSQCYKNQKSCFYTLRFDAMQIRTSVSLLGSDGALKFSPVSIVNDIHEFELEAK